MFRAYLNQSKEKNPSLQVDDESAASSFVKINVKVNRCILRTVRFGSWLCMTEEGNVWAVDVVG